jgi:indole-3-glycerol phosphate synthase
LNTSERLIAEAPPNRILISESGLQSADSLLRLGKIGFRGFLMGEALMRAPDPEMALRDLFAAFEDRKRTRV